MELVKVREVVEEFDRSNVEDRYSSFDFCFNHFRNNEFRDDIEKSCNVLGFYLASWGMLRGSSFLLGKSAKYYQDLIEYYSENESHYRNIDVNNYSKGNVDKLMELYSKTKEIFVPKNKSSLVLVTKIMLGVFGSVPAFDYYFTLSFKNNFGTRCRFNSFNEESLKCIGEFYQVNQKEIDELSSKTFTKDFLSAANTSINYPRAKIVDMYGFQNGINVEKG